jgi:hypothetical protein
MSDTLKKKGILHKLLLSPNPLTPTASNSSAQTAPEHTDKGPDNPKPAGK